MNIPDRDLRVLLVDDNAGSLSRFHELLSRAGIETELECVTTNIAALGSFRRNNHDVGIIDSPGGNAGNLLAEARRVGCNFPLVVVTSERASEVLGAMHNGAADCLIRDDLSPALLERTLCLALKHCELQEAHSENEERYLSLIEHASDIIYTHDLEGNYTSVNQAVTALTGYTKEEALKLNVRQVVAPEYLEFAAEMVLQKVAEQKDTSYEIEMLMKDGRRLPIDVSTHLIYRNGKAVAVQGIARNITRRREAQAALRDSEQRYRELFENANDIVYTHDVQGNFTSLNPAGERITGYSRDEAMRMNIANVLAPEYLENVRARIAQKIQPADYTLYQLDMFTKDGRRVSLEVNTKLICNDGEPSFIQGIGRDITERQRADKDLRASEQRYRQIVNDANEIICRLSLSGHFTFVNPVAARFMNSSQEDLIGREFLDLVRPDFRKTVQEFYREQIKQQVPTTYFEFPIVTDDGAEVWVSQNLQLIIEGGRVSEMQAVARDVTDRKLMEETLRKSEERYRAFVEHSSEAVWCLEMDIPCPVSLSVEDQIEHVYKHGYLAECNDVMARMYGFSVAGEIVGARLHTLLPKEDPKNVEFLTAFVKSGYRLSEAETQELDQHGEIKAFLNSLQGVIENEAVVRAWGTQRDITQAKRAQQEIDEANRRALADYDRLVERIATLGQTLGNARELKTIFRALRDFAVVSLPCDGMDISLYRKEDSSRRLVYCWADGQEFDPEKLEILPVGDGMTGRALKTGSICVDNEMQQHPPVRYLQVGNFDDSTTPQAALSAPMAIMGRVVGCIEIQSYKANAYTEDHLTAIRMAANLAANAVENVELIEREQQKAEQLRQAQKMEAVGQLAGGVAHDFNNLLTAITGYSDLSLRNLPATSPIRRNLEEIKRAGLRAASLTRQLLAFSRKQLLQPKTLELNAIVADMDKMLQRLIGEDIDLVTILHPDGCPVKADPGQIEQVILNLAVNARDAMPKGGKLTIETGRAQLDEAYATTHAVTAGDYIVLAVSDNGLGMDEETERRVFEPFFTTKEVGKGTGLGLSTVYGIVKQSGGSVWVYSEPGQGSTFKIYLPIATDFVTTAEPKVNPLEAPQGQGTILLAEDEEMVRNLSREVLEACGYKVLTASNGQEAWELCRTFKGEIALLITDVVMPQMGGRQLAEAVVPIRPLMSVLYMSGYTDDAVLRHGVLDDEMPFLQKPFSPDALAQKVKEVLDNAVAPIA